MRLASLRAFHLAPASLLLASLFIPGAAAGVGPRTFVLDSMEKLAGGDLKGVSVSSDGHVRAGWTLGNLPLPDATFAICSLALADGTILVGTNPNGEIVKVANDHATSFAKLEVSEISALAQTQNGTIYAASKFKKSGAQAVGGQIYKVTQGKAEVFATLPDTDSVFALIPDKAKTGLYAGTTGNGEGKVFHIDASGASALYYKSDEPFIVSLALADNGDVLAGSDGKGLLYRITQPGHATILYDFPGESVPAVMAGPRGSIVAIANEGVDLPEVPRRAGGGTRPPGPMTVTRPKTGKGSLYRLDAQGRPERLMHHDEFHYLSLAVDAQGVPYVGTAAEGRVYTADDTHVVTMLADVDSRQVGALGVANGKPYIVASDPAIYHRILGQGGADAVWTSKVLDAGLRARFGTLSWRANGALEMSMRTGNTATPDRTWVDWSAPIRSAAVIATEPGRFVQVRARWAADPRATLSEVTLPFMTDNIRPIVIEVNAHQSGTVPATREGLQGSGGPPPKHSTTVNITWKVDNADGDALRYRLLFRRDGQPTWREVLKPEDAPLTKTDYDWDTLALPEGKYRVKVEASDEAANPPDQVQRHALESGPFLVDNTPPTLTATMVGRRVKARAVDGVGPIVRIEMTVDGRLDWRPLAAADGMFDTAVETVDADVSALVAAGTSHIVTLRAFDAAGNAVTHDVEAAP